MPWNFLTEDSESWYIKGVCEMCVHYGGSRIRSDEATIISCECPEFIVLFDGEEKPRYNRQKHCKFVKVK